MLLELNIQNFAIIEKTNICFTKGLNIITGETGTGKSIIVDAINLVLGGRADRDYIKDGKDRTIVEALFYIEDMASVIDILTSNGIESEEDNNILITREVHTSGRSISRVNGRTVTLSMISNLTSKLIDIHGQNECQLLLNIEKHMEFIDLLGDESLGALKKDIMKEYLNLTKVKKNIKNLTKNEMEREREIDLLKFQIQEIDELSLEEHEEESLIKEYEILSNSKEISTTIDDINEKFSSSGYNTNSILDQLRNISVMIDKVAKYDEDLRLYSESIDNIAYTIDDIAKEIRGYSNKIEFNFERFAYIENRISDINKLKRKYGKSIIEILNYRDKVSKELDFSINIEDELKKLHQDIKNIETKLSKDCSELTSIRKIVSLKLEENIIKELKELNMDNIDFKVIISSTDNFTQNGKDKIEFYISTNAGQQLKPLSKVASGGEMSRIMLALKNILSGSDNINSLIFDEVDTGISGRTAQVVGEKIVQISKNHQVICITHLPQIASMANTHFLINKEFINNETITKIKKLQEEEQIDEICRLIGGVSMTETTRKHAKEMIEMSKSI